MRARILPTGGRSGLTLGEVLIVLGIVVLLAALFLVSYPYARFNKRRAACAANLKQIGNGMAVYSTSGSSDDYPIPAHLKGEEPGVGLVRYAPGRIGINRGVAGQPQAGASTVQDAELSTTRMFWYFVHEGWATPDSFVCPSSDDQPNNDPNPRDFWDFASYSEVSYGIQLPFGKIGWPSPYLNQDMALVADKGPYSAALEAGRPDPGVPGATRADPPEKWAPWNSPNHGGEGQNVMYNDAHVDFVMTPLAGVDKDNIYTRWSSADAGSDANELARIQGTPPTGIETPWSRTDSLIYP